MITIRSLLLAATASALVLPLSLSAQDSITGRAAVERLVGNTMVTNLVENDIGAQEGKLLLRDNGTAVWVNIQPEAEPVEVRWEVDDRGWLCMSGFPEDTVDSSCAGLTITGDQIIMNDEGSNSEGILDIRLIPGNPGGL